MIRDSAPFVITTSFSAEAVGEELPPRAACAPAASSAPRSRAVPSSTASSDGIELGERDLGEEAEAAEVDAEDRHVGARPRDAVGHADERAVAAEHDDQVARAAADRRA